MISYTNIGGGLGVFYIAFSFIVFSLCVSMANLLDVYMSASVFLLLIPHYNCHSVDLLEFVFSSSS